ncbi:Hypothetical protein PHPALM_16803 [Phytophthora palmivora]|uniref:Uncharacterized protein n=1 Tax=Phytophthora palmivora TaxID=4796 RepID=A0A2P4XNW3_9STRA|nr:Hypothetical protein PHPALM_16803 [Phytophthora palmivora]
MGNGNHFATIGIAANASDKKTDKGSDSITELLDFVLDVYGIDAVAQLYFYVFDHAPINIAIGKKTCVPRIGCASYRMKLAMQVLMEEHLDLLENVQG